ncbi:discoidin domain-containing protein [Actinopolymorpha alba]|uniref:discoidin domain-containing protein n=1 Tax=Actinopolymorpha alba TaxID=533267 RepID=UPI0003716F32|nr:discoidin domain-containing protein [Actinopolymorpha alba]
MRRLLLLAVILASVTLSATLPAAGSTGQVVRADASVNTITFALSRTVDPLPRRAFDVRLACAGRTAARATVIDPGRPTATSKHRAAGRTCTVTHVTAPIPGRVDEVTYTVTQGTDVLARRTLYARDGRGRSTEFVLPAGETRLELSVESLPKGEVGVPIRAMAFNIWRGGLMSGAPGGPANREQLIEFIRSEDPDILFLVEVEGSGEEILDGLNAGRPGTYQGLMVTREPGQPENADRLWLYSRFPIDKVYPVGSGGDLTSFNFGGARLKLPNGTFVNTFSTWLYHAPSAGDPLNQSALETQLGIRRTYSDQQIIDTDQPRRLVMATTLVQQRLREYIGDDPSPIILGGDFNTMSHLDWSGRFADAPGHKGLVLEWPVTKLFTDAGFTDVYRYALPDAGRYPGQTWSPELGWGFAPLRVDYLMSRGDGVRVLGAHTRSRRLPAHQGTPMDQMYPFYSDHAPVVSELLIRGKGPGPAGEAEVDAAVSPPSWPDSPPGKAIPPAELSAVASSENAGYEASRAVDGDLVTMWHSAWQPTKVWNPHDITIDLGKVRTLTAVRYQPRIVSTGNGIIVRATVQASADGVTFHDVKDVTLARDYYPKNISLDGLRARYLRLQVWNGSDGFSSAAEIIPFESD